MIFLLLPRVGIPQSHASRVWLTGRNKGRLEIDITNVWQSTIKLQRISVCHRVICFYSSSCSVSPEHVHPSFRRIDFFCPATHTPHIQLSVLCSFDFYWPALIWFVLIWQRSIPRAICREINAFTLTFPKDVAWTVTQKQCHYSLEKSFWRTLLK